MEQTLQLLLTYKYFIFFPLAIIEGPIITILGGFLVTMGIFNPFIIYVLTISGDAIGDTGLYALGSWGGKWFLKRFGPYLGINEEKLKNVEEYFHVNSRKAVAMSKLIHGIGMTGLFAAGSLRVPFKKFISTCFVISLGQTAVMLTIGILFGHAYLQIEKYLDDYAAIASIVALLGILIYAIYYKLKISRS